MSYDINILNFLRDSFFIILSWLLLACAFHTWGGFFSKIIGIRLEGTKCHFANIWLGWCFGLFFFAAYHLFFPVNAFASCVFYLPAIIFFFIKYAKRIIPFIKSVEKTKVIAILFSTLVIGTVAIQLPMNFDTGLYHLNTIRWINEHHIINGLGNLHTRLGFNQFFYLYCASLNFHPFLSSYGFHAANTFLYFILVTGGILSGGVIDLLLLILFFFLPVPYFWVVSPTTDVASCLLQIIAFRVFLDAIKTYYELSDSNMSDNSRLKNNAGGIIAIAAVLSAVLVTVKLSNVVFALGLGIITLFMGKKSFFTVSDKKIISKAFIFIGLFVCLWVVRGYIQTGYPVFPSSIGRINFDWTVPERLAKYTETYVYAGSRTDGLITNFDSPVLQDGAWVDGWIKEFFFDEEKHLSDDPIQNICTVLLLIFFPMTMYSWGIGCLTLFVTSGILFCVWVHAMIHKKSVLWNRSKLFLGLFIMEIASIIFWFMVAPEPRFANAIFVCEFVTCLLMVKAAYPQITVNNTFKKVVLFYSAIILILCFNIAYNSDEFRIDGMFVLRGVPMKTFVTKSGIELSVPVINNQCWDTTLLETPEPEMGLELRGDSIASGFRIKE